MVSVLSSIDTRHEDMIHDAQVDFYGTRLATCSTDLTVRIFEIKNDVNTLQAELRGHEGPVWQVAWAHPSFGTLLASCSYDRRVFIWKEVSVGRWEKLYDHHVHDTSVNSICWAPPEHGLILACGSSDGSISILYNQGGTWESKKISNAHALGCNAVSWAPPLSPPPSSTLVRRIVSGGCDNIVRIWRETDENWVEEAKIEAHHDWVRDVAWSPSIGLPHSLIASCSSDKKVCIHRQETEGGPWTTQLLARLEDVAWHVSWALTGHILAVSSGDNKVSLFKETLDGKWITISNMGAATNGR
ncbi:unnamed protein product [Cyprideis torosa]|uniref:Protein SEC13 homolog n=1 Tax=Cyprideis torosa TaxID=163714 RepID=A0A7R8W638_9CRUS|nr:unnamed protein product [Cyprideis torosa]CAG0880921.1 unnamed protein product [Cyprideis torosa]